MMRGRLEHVKHVKGASNEVFMRYALELNDVCGRSVFDVKLTKELLKKAEDAVFILQSEMEDVQGSGFIVKGLGLITNDHVTEDGRIYSVRKYTGELVTKVSNELNLRCRNEAIDYAVYSFGASNENALELGTSQEVKIGTKATLIGYPDYTTGNYPEIQTVEIISKRTFMGQDIYTVSGRVVHGASGGVVLDENHKVIGVIRCGAASLESSDDYPIQGFIPISDILNDINR